MKFLVRSFNLYKLSFLPHFCHIFVTLLSHQNVVGLFSKTGFHRFVQRIELLQSQFSSTLLKCHNPTDSNRQKCKSLLQSVNLLLSLEVQCLPLNRIILGQHKSDNTNRMIQLTNVFCVLFRYITGLVVSDYNKRLI